MKANRRRLGARRRRVRGTLAAACLYWVVGAAPAGALQFVEVPLPVGALVTTSFEFEGPSGGAVEITLVSRNGRGQPLAPFLHVAEVDFSGPAPVVLYRGFRIFESPLDPGTTIVEHDDLAISASVVDLSIEVFGVAGVRDTTIVPSITILPESDWLDPAELEQIRFGLGLGAVEYSTTTPSGSTRSAFGFRAVVPEPTSSVLMLGGLVVLGRVARRDRCV